MTTGGKRRAAPPPARAFAGRPWLVSLLALTVVAAAVGHWWWTRPAEKPNLFWLRHSRVDCDPAALAAVDETGAGLFLLPALSDDTKRDLAALGDRATPAVVRALLDQEAKYAADGPPRGTLASMRDATTPAGFAHLRDHGTAESDSVLMRLLRDRHVWWATRRNVVIALCREGTTVFQDLTAFALDPGEDETLRGDVLARLHLTGEPPPPSLRRLTAQANSGLAVMSACALAAAGDPWAPSLVAEVLCDDDPRWASDSAARSAALAAAATLLRQDDCALSTSIESFLQTASGRRNNSPVGDPESERGPYRAATEGFLRRMDRRRASDSSPFDRATVERRARRDADPRFTVAGLDDVLSRGEDDIDVAATLFAVLALPPSRAGFLLDHLDRMAACAAPRVEAAETPADKMRALWQSLETRPSAGGWGEDWSSLEVVLRTNRGNCVGCTTLLIAVGDRLGLPLRPVLVPQHVYVMWEDGSTRLSFDPMADEFVVTDEAVAARHITGHAPPGSPWNAPRPITRRRLASIYFSNRGAAVSPPEGAAAVATALALAPDNSHALVLRAQAIADSADVASRRTRLRAAAADAERAGLTYVHAAMLAETLSRSGEAAEALALADRVGAVEAPLRIARARALCRARRFTEALQLARELVKELPDDLGVVSLLGAADFLMNPGSEMRPLERTAPLWKGKLDPRSDADHLRIAIASQLLDLTPADSPLDGAPTAITLLEACYSTLNHDSFVPAGSFLACSGDLGFREQLARAWERRGDAARAKRIRSGTMR